MRGMAVWLRSQAAPASTFASRVRRRLHPVMSADEAAAAYWRTSSLRRPGDRRTIMRLLRRAADVLRPAAENGDARAAYDLGQMLEYGWHGQRRAEAQRYYLIASELGYRMAHARVASMNERGPGGPGQPPGQE